MITKRTVTLACVGALAAMSAVAISATTWIGASAAPGEVRLHLGGDSQKFTFGGTTQSLTANKCALQSNGQVIGVTSTPNGSSPGLVDLGLGVKSGGNGATGTPCGQVESPETLTFSRGPALAGRSFTGLRLDLELTKNALVTVTLISATDSRVYTLQTGTNITPAQAGEPGISTSPPYIVNSGEGDETDACAAPNSSGPNSGSNDNCQWNINPNFNFTSFKLATTVGTVTLEGGNDFGPGTANDTLFYIGNAAPVAVNDSTDVDQNRSNPDTNNSKLIPVLANDSDADGDSLSIPTDSVSDPAHGTAVVEGSSIRYTPDDDYTGPDSFTYQASDGTARSLAATVSIDVVQVMCSLDTVSASDPVSGATGTFTRLTDPVQCKRYQLAVGANQGGPTVLFQPQGGADVDYRGFINFGPKPEPVGPLSLLLQYDPENDGTFKNVQWCDNPVFDATGTVTAAAVPAGETWCIASETTVGQGTGQIKTTWQIWGHDDPNFK
jgi:hypothetical protein